ncbi:MAG: CHASE2 domain-containing protein, partial [Chthoniobacteraceae bacterium]
MSWLRRYNRKAPIIICIVFTALVAGLYSIHWNPLLRGEFYIQNVLTQFGRRAKLRPDLVYLAIDRDSVQLDQFDQTEIDASPALSLMKQGWPFSRAVYPLIFDKLIASGAKVVALDFMFPTPREGDEAFHAALDKYKSNLVIASNFAVETRGAKSGTTLQMPSDDLIKATSPIDNRVGYVNFWPDTDGVVRSAYYGVTPADLYGEEEGQETYRSLAARVLQKTGNGKLIPSPGAHRFRFAGPAGTFKPRSLCDIFDSHKWNVPEEYDGGRFFKDKIILLGPEGNFMKDVLLTPFGEMPGPEIHLNAINAALQGEFFSETSNGMDYTLIGLAAVIAWLLSVQFPSPLLRLFLLAIALLAWLGTAFILYDYANLSIFTFNPLLVLGSSGVFSLSWDFFVERREKAR